MAEHRHRWSRPLFVAGIEVRHCEQDCAAAQARGPDGEWERTDPAGWKRQRPA